jgi:formylglycine-generating enzyme required for sulfatase activity
LALSWAGFDFDLATAVGYDPAFDNTGTYNYSSPVGSFGANGYGLYDMAGNVRQWCWDWYASGSYGSGSQSDPHGLAGPDLMHGIIYRMLRGGDWNDHVEFCCAATRSYNTPDYEGLSIGFRTVLPLGQ